ncbi:MAG: hypothetical protein ACOC35_11400, partial [Promethearchaeia archaeon]
GNFGRQKVSYKTYRKDLNSAEISNKILNFYQQLGKLLTQHHTQLKNNIVISTPIIDPIIEHCMDAGAYGVTINGSGWRDDVCISPR